MDLGIIRGIVSSAEKAKTFEELQRAVIEFGLALIQLEQERRADDRVARTEKALLTFQAKQGRR